MEREYLSRMVQEELLQFSIPKKKEEKLKNVKWLDKQEMK
jgi:hypothetical protein